MTEAKKSTALILKTPSEVQNQIEVYMKQNMHVLSPYLRTKFDSFMSGARPDIQTTTLDPDPNNPDVYESTDKKGELGLSKIALEKLGKLAGIMFTGSRRIVNIDHPHVSEYSVEGKLQRLDGTWYFDRATGVYDLRDGSPQAKAMTPARLAKARQHINALAESKAKLRLIRGMLGVKHSYSPKELQKPFVVIRLVPDENDERNQELLRASMLGLEGMMFGKKEGENAEETHAVSGDLPQDLEVMLNEDGSYGVPVDKTTGEIQEPPPPDEDLKSDRPEKIHRIKDFYYMKTKDGHRDPKKPPLEDLTDSQLDEMIAQFEKLPNVREPRQDSLI
jgi:hypothetical protein